MDIITSLFAIAGAYVAASSALVWGITEVIKRRLPDQHEDCLTPFIALGASLSLNVLVWLYTNPQDIQSFIPFAIASLLIFAGSDSIHDVKERMLTKKTDK